jgi:hypothetical protein
MKRWILGVVCAAIGGTGAITQACGGESATIGDTDASTDASTSDGATVDAEMDAAPTCPPPSDPTKASLCISATPETIAFVPNDPNLDGKGILAIDVYSMATPDTDGGASAPLASQLFPSQDAGAGAEFDLSTPIPMVRFEVAPGTVYPRVVFVDSRTFNAVGAGWWLGNYDLSNGLVKNTPLQPVTLTAGAGTSVAISLTALRRFHVVLTRSATPTGNGQGPATVVAIPDSVPHAGTTVYGIATNPCAKLTGNLSAEANGFVFGKGPYYGVAVLDDFGIGGGGLAPGSLTSLAFADGGVTSPPGTQLTYAPNAYLVTQTLDLDLALPKPPDAGVDPVSCP